MIITIVTPTLNAVEFFKECIESVKRQESSNVSVEHVIVDGGSSDGTVELAESYSLRVMQGKDRGIFDAINKGSFNSSGGLIGFLGADDLLLEGALDEVVRRYHESDRLWVSGGVRFIDSRGDSLGELAAPPRWMTSRLYACFGWSCIGHQATYMCRDFFVELGGFDLTYKVAADYEFFCRALARAPYSRIPRTLAGFRDTGQNFGAINVTAARQEGRTIRQLFGPHSAVVSRLYYLTLRSWVYGTNPRWGARKLAGRLPFARKSS